MLNEASSNEPLGEAMGWEVSVVQQASFCHHYQWLWKTETGLQSNITFTTESYQWMGRWIDRTRTVVPKHTSSWVITWVNELMSWIRFSSIQQKMDAGNWRQSPLCWDWPTRYV